MLKLFKNNFKTTNDCIILATPLIIFLSVLGWYFEYARLSVDSLPKLILAIITMLIMTSGCFAAWFYMCKKTLSLANKVFVFDKDRAKAFGDLIMTLPKGIGRLFLPFIGVIMVCGLVYGVLIWGATFFVAKYIGTIDINLITSENLLISSQELINEINALSRNEIIVINCWYLLVFALTTLVSFFGLLWIPEIVYCERNPFSALLNSIKKLVITFPKSLVLYIYINILTITVSILCTLLMLNPIAYFIVLVLHYYLIVYIVVLIFSYYEQLFIKNEKD